jgi:Phage terminase large subunit
MSNAIKPTPWQADVLAAPEDINLALFGGRGRGATTCALLLIIRACEKYPNSHHAYMRNHLKSLNEVMDTLQFLLVGAFGTRALKINRSDSTFRLPNGSTINFMPMADSLDLAKAQGLSYDTVTVDEYGNFSPAQMRYVDNLRANLRGANGCPKRFVFLANPAGVGHTQCVNRFIRKLPAWTPTTLADETEWLYCPATFLENSHLPKTYQRDLMASAGRDRELMRAWTDGAWDVAKGSILNDVLDSAKQMFAVENIGFDIHNRASHLFLSGDWGISSPSVVYLASRLLAPLGPYPRNSLVLIDEISSADPDDLSVGLQWSPSYLADRINEMCDLHKVRNRSGIFDDSRGLGDDTVIKIMAQFGLHFVKPRKGRLENLSAMRELLFNSMAGNNRPGMWVSSRCSNWWDTVPLLPPDPLRNELPDSRANDHSFDASVYAVSHSPRIAQSRILGGNSY